MTRVTRPTGAAHTAHRQSRTAVRAAGFAALVALAILVSATAGSAAVVHPFVAGASAGSNPQAVAVDQSTGDVYVIDVGAGAVLKFDASGSPASFSALGSNSLDGATGAGATLHGAFAFDAPSAAQVAVDNSGGPTDGYLYVASLAGVVDAFDRTGTWVGQLDGSAATPLSGGEVCGVATDPAGHVYAGYFGSAGSGHVDEYTPTDANPAHDTFAGQLEGLGGVCNIAADGLGSIYVSTWQNGPLTKYDSSQLNQPAAAGTQVDATSLAVAVDPGTNDVYVDHGDRIAEYDPSGSLVGTSGAGTLSGGSRGVAIKASDADLYASDSGTAQLDHFGAGIDVPLPVVTIDPPSAITSSHATFSGTVNPSGTDPLSDTSWHFEYSLDGGSTWTSTPGGDLGTGTTPVSVSDDVDTFLPDQAVQVRLVASNAGGSATSSIESFTTTAVAPDGVTGTAEDISPTHATLAGTVNAHHSPTTFYFEYGTTASYGSSVPPSQDADGGSGTDTTAVFESLHNLSPGTTYHFRIVVHNQAETVRGQDETFTTTTAPAAGIPRAGIPGTGLLPDDRGWEQASPVDKHGADVMASFSRVQAAASESQSLPMAVTFASLGAFADAQGTGVANDYMSIRTGQPGGTGWSTHAITPRQEPLSLLAGFKALDPLWEGDLSPDLTHGIYRAWSPLTNAPNVADVENIYLRDDLRRAGDGSYRLLSDCPGCSSPLPPILETAELPHYAGASSDFSHIIFESVRPLTPDSTAVDDPSQEQFVPNLYEWSDGVLRVAGILPNGAVAPHSIAGQGQLNFNYTPHAISADGSRIVFTDTTNGDPSHGTGTLYMRTNGASTAQISGSQPATFWDASSDGSRVFFTTAEQLTSEDTHGVVSLYMYDANAPAGDRLTLLSVDHEPADEPGDVQGVIGASDDGHYVYFIAAGQLVAGGPITTTGGIDAIYEWHDGAISYVGTLRDASDAAATLVNVAGHWAASAFPGQVARVTPDGRTLLFGSHSGAGLTGYDHGTCNGGEGCVELYVYSADSHQLKCASCDPNGSPPTADASNTVRTGTGASVITWHRGHVLSDDGTRVFFSTAEALVPSDTNGKSDAYEYDVGSGTAHLLSSGTDPSDSFFMDASANGGDAFFVTRQQLVGWDNDQNYDLYDARAGGGLPDPPPVAPACSGDSCHGQPAAAPEASVPGSVTAAGAGNVRSAPKRAKPRPKPLRCRRGLVRKRVKGKLRCVKPAGRHSVKQAKRARVQRRSR